MIFQTSDDVSISNGNTKNLIWTWIFYSKFDVQALLYMLTIAVADNMNYGSQKYHLKFLNIYTYVVTACLILLATST